MGVEVCAFLRMKGKERHLLAVDLELVWFWRPLPRQDLDRLLFVGLVANGEDRVGERRRCCTVRINILVAMEGNGEVAKAQLRFGKLPNLAL